MRQDPPTWGDPEGGETDLGACPVCHGDPIGCVDEVEIQEGDMFPEGETVSAAAWAWQTGEGDD